MTWEKEGKMNFWYILVNDFFLLIFGIVFLIIVGHSVVYLVHRIARTRKKIQERKLEIIEDENIDIIDPVCL